MIRFIIRRKWRDAISCAESEFLESVLCEAPELERILSGGGHGEGGFDIRELVGAEIEQFAPSPAAEWEVRDEDGNAIDSRNAGEDYAALRTGGGADNG